MPLLVELIAPFQDCDARKIGLNWRRILGSVLTKRTESGRKADGVGNVGHSYESSMSRNRRFQAWNLELATHSWRRFRDSQTAGRLAANAIAPEGVKLGVGGSCHWVVSSKGTEWSASQATRHGKDGYFGRLHLCNKFPASAKRSQTQPNQSWMWSTAAPVRLTPAPQWIRPGFDNRR